MQLLFVVLTVSAIALLKRGHELAAAAATVMALFAMLVGLAS